MDQTLEVIEFKELNEIFLHYPVWAGGKFVWTCLAQSDQVMLPYKTDLSTYEQHVEWLKNAKHSEFDENFEEVRKVYRIEDKFYPNVIHELPEQDVPCLYLYNYDWIIIRRAHKTRTTRLEDLKPNKPHKIKSNTHLFDMQSLLSKNKFLKEIELTCNWLDIDTPNKKHLEHVRELFVETCHHGF